MSAARLPRHDLHQGAPRGDRLSLWERPREARVRVPYERKRSCAYATLTPTLSQRERELP